MGFKICSTILSVSLVVSLAGLPGRAAAAGGAITMRQDITPVRIMVVDGNAHLLEIWNAVSPGAENFDLQIRLGNRAGDAVALTPEILAIYQEVLPYLDLKVQGLVYDATAAPWQKLNDVLFVTGITGPSLEIYTHS